MMMMNKIEYVKVEMQIKKEGVTQLASELKTILGYSPSKTVIKDDFLTVDWDFWIEYFGDIVPKLKAINSICKNPDTIAFADCKLLEEGNCLVFEVFTNLKQVIQTIKERE